MTTLLEHSMPDETRITIQDGTEEQDSSLMGQDMTCQYNSNGELPPPTFIDNLWKYMENSVDSEFTLTIKNVNLMEGIGLTGDTLDVVCHEFIKLTEENEENLKDMFEPTSSFWTTKKGIFMVFSDNYNREIPMAIANTAIPFILTKKETGESFNCIDYKPEIITKIADKTTYLGI